MIHRMKTNTERKLQRHSVRYDLSMGYLSTDDATQNKYMLKVCPVQHKHFLIQELEEAGICSGFFHNRLQQLELRFNCTVSFKFMLIAGKSYYFDEYGCLQKGMQGSRVKLEYCNVETARSCKQTTGFLLF